MGRMDVLVRTTNQHSNVEELELRLMHMEALIKELRFELEELKHSINDDDLKRIHKMKAYQEGADRLFGMTA